MTCVDIKRIYMDYNATAPCRPEVAERVARVLASGVGNPSSLHAEGRAARAIVEDARDCIAEAIGADPLEIVFTSGGTEADNMAIEGVLRASGARRHIVTTTIEHPAVLHCARQCAARDAATVTYVPCDGEARVSPRDVVAALDSNTCLVSIMHANNEVGTVQPIRAMVDAMRDMDVLFHSDAVQSLGRIPVDVRQLGVDLLSASGHKLGGPKGTGFLYVRSGSRLAPFLAGGSQERERRAGTENVAGIAGLATAVSHAVSEQSGEATRLAGLKQMLWDGLAGGVEGIHVNGSLEEGLPNTLSISIENISGEDLMMALDLGGLAISTGSACAVGAGKPSHVIEAMGLSGALGCGPVRFSLGYGTTEGDVARAVETVVGVVNRLKSSGALCCCATSCDRGS